MTAKTKTKAKRGGRKPATKKASVKSTAKTASKPADDSESLVVFAFRLTRAERDAIHAAAGSAKASRLVKGAALAAAKADLDAFRKVVAEASGK